jgi:transcriptional regulator with XRE-family HTH domain
MLRGERFSSLQYSSMAKIHSHPKPERQRHYIKEWRKYRTLTQEQLAERIGKTHGAISQLERGKIDYTQGMIEALAEALSCEPGDLLSRNPIKEGEVIDLLALLREKDPAVVRAILEGLPPRTGTDG